MSSFCFQRGFRCSRHPLEVAYVFAWHVNRIELVDGFTGRPNQFVIAWLLWLVEHRLKKGGVDRHDRCWLDFIAAHVELRLLLALALAVWRG